MGRLHLLFLSFSGKVTTFPGTCIINFKGKGILTTINNDHTWVECFQRPAFEGKSLICIESRVNKLFSVTSSVYCYVIMKHEVPRSSFLLPHISGSNGLI